MDIYKEISEIKRGQEETLTLLRNISENGVADCKKKIYDLTDLEEMLHVSRRLLFSWKDEGKFNYSQIGNKIYVTEADLNEFLTNNKREGGSLWKKMKYR